MGLFLAGGNQTGGTQAEKDKCHLFKSSACDYGAGSGRMYVGLLVYEKSLFPDTWDRSGSPGCFASDWNRNISVPGCGGIFASGKCFQLRQAVYCWILSPAFCANFWNPVCWAVSWEYHRSWYWRPYIPGFFYTAAGV